MAAQDRSRTRGHCSGSCEAHAGVGADLQSGRVQGRTRATAQGLRGRVGRLNRAAFDVRSERANEQPAIQSAAVVADGPAPRLPHRPYEVVAPLGAGGMGEVYRARDTKLGRDVALKVLPDAFAHDPERLARFEREAQVARVAEPPEHRRDLRPRGPAARTRWCMELVEVRRWPIASRAARFRSTKRCRSRGRSPRRSKRRTSRHRPPRSEAGEHQDPARRHGEGARFRARQGARRGSDWARAMRSTTRRRSRRPAMTRRRDPRHRRLHEPRAGAREGVDRRARHLGVRLRALRDAHRPRAFAGEEVTDTMAPILRGSSRTGSELPATTPEHVRDAAAAVPASAMRQKRLHDIGDRHGSDVAPSGAPERRGRWPSSAPMPRASRPSRRTQRGHRPLVAAVARGQWCRDSVRVECGARRARRPVMRFDDSTTATGSQLCRRRARCRGSRCRPTGSAIAFGSSSRTAAGPARTSAASTS